MNDKTYYICTAIPYVNDKPHLGHAILHLYADVLARYNRQLGNDVLFNIGTDEHGGKIAEVAAKGGVDPKKFADDISAKFSGGLKDLGISSDRFVRTTDPQHEKIAAEIWKKLSADIYKKSYTGWYCVGCEAYYTETHVKETNGICPHHNRAYDKLEEENYFFKLSSYGTKILEEIESGRFKIVPDSRKNEIVNVIKGGLEDISISRPASKISWGIPVPGDATQTMYVWFEALMNYITTLGYPNHPDFEKYWPANVQVIGKDILRFHAAIWPAMLMGLGLPLPAKLYVHGFVTSGGQKMSKTLGNVVDPLDVASEYGLDAFRYFFLRYGPVVDDVDFTEARFEAAYNGELANELGNAVQRVASMAMKYMDGVVGDVPDSEHDQGPYHEALAACRFDKALDLIWDQIRGLNQYIDTAKPWSVAKEGDSAHLREILAYCVSCLNEIAELLVPFMPETSAKISATFADGIIRLNDTTLFPKKDQ
jgi:methionyl-tRNA synthetase